MKNPLDKDDFEFYLEQEVNQHRMYPSDHIWRNIQQDIHGHKKWPALTVITLFVISALVVGTILIKPQHQLAALTAANMPLQKAPGTEAEAKQQPAENMQEHFSPEHITQQTIARVVRDIDITDNISTALSAYNNNIQDFIPQGNVAASFEPVYTSSLNTNEPLPAAADQKPSVAKKEAQPANNQVKSTPVFANLINLVPNDDVLYGSLLKLPKSKKTKPHSGFMFSVFEKIEPASPYTSLALDNNNFSTPVHKSFKFKPRNPHLEFSFYAAPSISYRRLSYNNQGMPNHTYISGLPYNAGYTVDVSRATRNKPATGYEVGASLGYKINDVITLRSGLQFNMREYDIEAYKLTPQAPSTSNSFTTDNNSTSSLGGGGVNVSSPSSASLSGNNRIILQNRYYQISIPLGIDVSTWKSGRFAVGVASSIQPTYIFDKDPFIITSDYKGYTDGSKLVRNWNINTALETYLSYSTGKFKWQIGPQFRYQLLSTLSGSYPIKEHLLDYGVKIGIVKSLR